MKDNEFLLKVFADLMDLCGLNYVDGQVLHTRINLDGEIVDVVSVERPVLRDDNTYEMKIIAGDFEGNVKCDVFVNADNIDKKELERLFSIGYVECRKLYRRLLGGKLPWENFEEYKLEAMCDFLFGDEEDE